MANVLMKGNPVQTSGTLPAIGSQAPDFKLVRSDLSEATLDTYSGKKKLLNIFISIDTGTCAESVRKFNQEAASLPNVAVLNISADLPFAQKRFCGTEGINNCESLSSFRSKFGTDYGVTIIEGALTGLYSRAVVVLDEKNKVVYSEQVQEMSKEPNYENALKALRS